MVGYLKNGTCPLDSPLIPMDKFFGGKQEKHV
ncbi:hypothetical protein Dhaf_3517 [Desulfitobacterium hafniense DCB-2]|uniref:Uncharacterized protein n=1 Tax=Desulfitobacterium hafniense (strain DSM 10664 / DCB-2) TaxID=272564 RepID=B8FQ74_DESHD|nr:hypothetical protein Dhaf_3517 [Desulfitobacterium hafniense DCB-2]